MSREKWTPRPLMRFDYQRGGWQWPSDRCRSCGRKLTQTPRKRYRIFVDRSNFVEKLVFCGSACHALFLLDQGARARVR